MPRLEIVLPMKVLQASVTESRGDESNDHVNGFRAGYQEGLLKAGWEAGRRHEVIKREVLHMMKRFQRIHVEFETLVSEHLPILIHHALDRVFKKHRFTPEEVSGEVLELINDLDHAGKIALECSPEDEPAVSQLLKQYDVAEDQKLKISVNLTLKQGEFLLKSELGHFDGRHLTRMRQISEALDV